MIKTIALVVTMAAFAAVGNASERNDIPSCYDYAQLSEYKPSQPNREIFVIVDKTVNLDINLKKSVHQQLQHFNQSGDKVTIVTFSALAQGDYTDIVFSGLFESGLSSEQRNSMNRMKLKKLEHCLDQQRGAINSAHKLLASAFPTEQDSYPKTELVGTILNLSTDLVARSNADRKIVLVVSDMLENSDSLSFYRQGSVYIPSASDALATIDKAGFKGDFDHSDIYVIGAGFIEGAKRYSSQKSVNELESFWRSVITKNNGQLRQFGKPSLLTQIQ
ncbi:hypothetical protein [Vibrio aestuarianus]|uniref:hypothetical protein n=1 Tax=Vibrio aestuarianus TaxID=28171 RepID=UPI00237CAADB|nr:hypothetical protein [Vibrio aestuarianus]MDE1210186.1 hypothetical protein [Vibrio aestuarianus]MDE1220660.1 hypothetical protein [Vibrio aestuarianus]MDE1340506.1 hypothetical protein [Vibrio aestuarianus]